MSTIHYFTEDITFALQYPDSISQWIIATIHQEQRSLADLNFIFCSDRYLHLKNKQYLGHDTLTDVITFDQSETDHVIQGDIYISIERVADNARMYDTTFEHELYRVMVHGVLHLIGYNDKDPVAQNMMRQKEDLYLIILNDEYDI